MVRVLAIADELAPALDLAAVRRIAPDLVVGAGDLPWDYLEFFASAVDVPCVFVPGNHDPAVPRTRRSRNGVYTRDGRVIDGPRPYGVRNVDGEVVSVGGLVVAGLGGCVRYNDGPHQYTQREYHRRARRLVRRARRHGGTIGPVDLLLTHAPPRHLGDEEDPPHHGIEALHGVLDALQPTYHLHGHIHPYGQPRPDRAVGRTTVRNVVPYAVVEIAPRAEAHSPGIRPEATRQGTMGR